MNIQHQNGVVSTISFAPFYDTSEYIGLREKIFTEAATASNIRPLNHLDIFDESILTFESIQQALSFLISVLRASSRRENYTSLNLSIKSSLCSGEYFIHQDQIYGEAVNLATKLSYCSRKNELLLSHIEPSIVESIVARHPDIQCFTRSGDEQNICVALIDDDITAAEVENVALMLEFNEQSKVFNSSRNRKISLGRSLNSDIYIDNDMISRNHATIVMQDQRIYLQDHSSNGSYIYQGEREIFVTQDSVELSADDLSDGEIYLGIKKSGLGSSQVQITYQSCDLTLPDDTDFIVH